MSSVIKKKFSVISLLIFIIILVLFCYFRLKALHFQTVGYTYDQGRDFLEAAKIVTEKNLTFIGPTTGIGGLYHGAWWYYLLTIPFLLFGGSPIGFYYFNFLLQLASFLILGYFLLRNFSILTTLIILLIIATSPYFIFTSLFVGNNIMVLPVLLLFLLANYFLLEKNVGNRTKYLLFGTGLLLGFITEFELAFGLFLIPIYVFLIIVMPKLRVIVSSFRTISFFGLGLLIPFIPRLLFEIKNNFQQTHIFLNALSHKAAESPQSLTEAYQGRGALFISYFRSLFESEALFVIALFILILTFISQSQDKTSKLRISFVFFTSLLGLLFFLSGLNKDSFFWGNYFEGIQYIYLLLLAFIISTTAKKTLFRIIYTFLLGIFMLITVGSSLATITQRPPNQGTLAHITQVVDYIGSQHNPNDEYCVKVFTPPAIPYTYNYLFLQGNLSKKNKIPQKDWVEGKCWFIIERDDNQERQNKWLEDNLPRKTNLLKEQKFDTIVVRLYERI